MTKHDTTSTIDALTSQYPEFA